MGKLNKLVIMSRKPKFIIALVIGVIVCLSLYYVSMMNPRLPEAVYRTRIVMYTKQSGKIAREIEALIEKGEIEEANDKTDVLIRLEDASYMYFEYCETLIAIAENRKKDALLNLDRNSYMYNDIDINMCKYSIDNKYNDDPSDGEIEYCYYVTYRMRKMLAELKADAEAAEATAVDEEDKDEEK